MGGHADVRTKGSYMLLRVRKMAIEAGGPRTEKGPNAGPNLHGAFG